MAKIYLSEYVNRDRTAQVYRDLDTGNFIVKCWEKSQEHSKEYNTEFQAQDAAEDWVLAAP